MKDLFNVFRMDHAKFHHSRCFDNRDLQIKVDGRDQQMELLQFRGYFPYKNQISLYLLESYQ